MGVLTRRLLVAATLVLVTACGGGGGGDDENGPALSQLSIIANQDVGASPITITGTATSATDGVLLRSVTVNNVVATITGASFSVDVPLTSGSNQLTIVAVDADGNTSTQSITVNYTPPEVLSTAMTAGEVIPPSATAATGLADISLNVINFEITGGVNLTNMLATTVEIHDAYGGLKGGALILALEVGADSTQWNIPAGQVLNLVDFESFMQGRFYVMATDGNPGEVVRGQLIPQGIEFGMIQLAGEHVVPEVATAASGVAAFTLDIATRIAQIHVNLENAPSAITGVDIQQEFAGHNGTGVLSLQDDMMEAAGDPDHWFLQDLTLTGAQDLAYLAGELYLNIQTIDNPTGALRGQIVPDAIDVFFTDLIGAQVVGDGISILGVSTTATAEAATTGDPVTKTITVYLNTNDLDDATSVTLNQAPAGQHGPVAVTLNAEPDDDDPNDGIVRRWLVRNHQLTDAQWAAYASQGLYANVTTPGFPVGEVRGQLIPPGSSATDFTAFQVLDNSFAPGEVFTAFPEVIWVTFTEPVLPESLSAMNIIVEGASGDMDFSNGVILIEPNTRDVSSADPDTVILGFLGVNAGADTYRLRIIGDSDVTAPLTDFEGLIFDGDANGSPGGNYQALFAVSDALQVASTSFLANETFTSFPTTVTVTFTKAVDANTVNAGNVFVEASGNDGTFGDGNEAAQAALARQVSPDGFTVTLTFDPAGAQADTFQLVVIGNGGGALMSIDGQAFDGDGDLMAGGNYAKPFIFAPQAATFTRVQNEVFNVSCASSACHDAINPAAGLSLVAGAAYDNLVNQMSTIAGTLVIPMDADNSVLVGRIEGTITPQMPIGGVLGASLQQLVRDWVANGALNN